MFSSVYDDVYLTSTHFWACHCDHCVYPVSVSFRTLFYLFVDLSAADHDLHFLPQSSVCMACTVSFMASKAAVRNPQWYDWDICFLDLLDEFRCGSIYAEVVDFEPLMSSMNTALSLLMSWVSQATVSMTIFDSRLDCDAFLIFVLDIADILLRISQEYRISGRKYSLLAKRLSTISIPFQRSSRPRGSLLLGLTFSALSLRHLLFLNWLLRQL